MSINWVMLDASAQSFTDLPGEQRLYTSPHRTSLSLQSLSKNPAREPFSATCADGRVYLTSRRIVYIPTQPPPPTPSRTTSSPSTPPLQSFSAPLTHIHDAHVTAPWFGPNEILALVQPVPNGGIPGAAVNLKITFREGGAYDFYAMFVDVKERFAQAFEARGLAVGTDTRRGNDERRAEAEAAISGELIMEDLPEYSAGPAPSVSHASRPSVLAPVALRPSQSQSRPPVNLMDEPASPLPAAEGSAGTPADAPPGYEETQSGSIAAELDRRLSDMDRQGR